MEGLVGEHALDVRFGERVVACTGSGRRLRGGDHPRAARGARRPARPRTPRHAAQAGRAGRGSAQGDVPAARRRVVPRPAHPRGGRRRQRGGGGHRPGAPAGQRGHPLLPARQARAHQEEERRAFRSAAALGGDPRPVRIAGEGDPKDAVTLAVGAETVELRNDYVFVFAGGEPPYAFLRAAGVSFGGPPVAPAKPGMALTVS